MRHARRLLGRARRSGRELPGRPGALRRARPGPSGGGLEAIASAEEARNEAHSSIRSPEVVTAPPAPSPRLDVERRGAAVREEAVQPGLHASSPSKGATAHPLAARRKHHKHLGTTFASVHDLPQEMEMNAAIERTRSYNTLT